MEINAPFQSLWGAIKKMGASPIEFHIEKKDGGGSLILDTELGSKKGFTIIDLDDMDTEDGILKYKSRQVLLFIPDHGFKIDDVMSGRNEGNRFHVSDCKTLNDMKIKKRFDRYSVTNNLNGFFGIYGTSKGTGEHLELDVELHVCKNCLSYLNYNGYNTDGWLKKKIYKEFDIGEFLTTYSTLFNSFPNHINESGRSGYVDNWKTISSNYRQSKKYTCENCNVNLSANKSLLHTHHINGNKGHNSSANLSALCIDCHRKQPHHSYMHVKHEDMLTLDSLRKEQGVDHCNNWDDILRLADTSVRDLLRFYKHKEISVPKLSYSVGSDKSVATTIDIAWPAMKKGVAINPDARLCARNHGWDVRSFGEALLEMEKFMSKS